MENWNSEWIDQPEDITPCSQSVPDLPLEDIVPCLQSAPDLPSEDTVSCLQSAPDLPSEEVPPESPTCSRHSRASSETIEGELDTKAEKCEESVIKTNPTSVFLAKKRLQAYSKQVRKSPSKEEKVNVVEERSVKFRTKKSKKSLPDEKAKAVILEIEELKRREFEDYTRRQAVATAIRSISIHGPQSPDRDSTFKRREVKRRNYRRSDSSSRKSPTPDDGSGRRRSYSSLREPRGWSEYRKPTVVPKSGRLKSVSRKDFINLTLLEKLYNFHSPSSPIGALPVDTENGIKTVPFSCLKVTKSRPHLVYSVNSEKTKDSFIAREQLFQLLSSTRRQAINDVINSQSRLPPYSKTTQSQSWYNKMWRRSANPECKVLENSVGLSFLQNYSDEDDDNETEEIVICSGIQQKFMHPISTVFTIQNHAVLDSKDLKIQRQPVEPVEPVEPEISPVDEQFEDDPEIYTPDMSQSESICMETNKSEDEINKSEDETGILTPEISSSQLLKIRQVVDQPIETPQSDPEESREEEKVSKRKKSTKRKLGNSIDEELPKRKKKKKVKKPAQSDDSDSSQEKRKKKKQKKLKNKEKSKKKVKASSKKSKKKAELAEDNKKRKKVKKKKKKKSVSVESKSPLLDDLRKKLKKKAKKKLSRKTETSSKSNVADNPEISIKFKHKNKSKNSDDENHSDSYYDPISTLGIEIKQEIDHYQVEDAAIRTTTEYNTIPNIVIKTEPVDEYFTKAEGIKKVSPSRNIELKDNWESDDEGNDKIKPNLNSGWESDEEVYKTENRVVEIRDTEKTRDNDTILDLEIPLNIRPFKKRDTQIINLEKTDSDRSKIISDDNQNGSNTPKESEKKGRWDIRESQSKMLTDSLTLKVGTHKVLENEYEEFIKAVSTNTKETVDSPSITSIISDKITTGKAIIDEEIVGSAQQPIIAPKDIPFIPMPNESKLELEPVNSSISSNLINVPINVRRTNTPQSNQDASIETPKKTQFSFTSLVLPTKKTLIDNSNLKLGDDEDERATVMKPVTEIRQEYLFDMHFDRTIHSIQKNCEFLNIEPKNNPEPISERRRSRSRSPVRSSRRQDDKSNRRTPSPKRDSHRRRDTPPRRRGYSPRKDYSPRRRRSPDRYRDKSRSSPGRRYSSRRSHSPNYRKRSPSPRRRSPRRSVSPRDRSSKKSRNRDTSDRMEAETKRQTSSPLERLKRSVADSTISDDSLLPQPSLDDYTQSPVPHYFDRMKPGDMRKVSVDSNMQMKLGMQKEEFRPINTTYDNFCQNNFSQRSAYSTPLKQPTVNVKPSHFVQIGNMVEIVPTDMDVKTDVSIDNIRRENKSQILQVGNMLQIVPTELLPELPPLPPSPKKEIEVKAPPIIAVEKPSAEATMKQKIAERRSEREKRRKEREERRKEKENRRREKEKRRQVKMKQKTENMIKKALLLEVEGQDGKDAALNELPTQWPPIHISGSSKDSNKSILVRGIRSTKSKRKVVQFADGIRPGEGTSPSAGEELASTSPKVLPKEKRYTKTKLRLKNMKKKVKVKIIKPTEQDEECEEDNLPPPSPPPGSPPPHIFPPRIKPQSIANHPPFVPNVVNQTNLFRPPPVSMLMMPPQPTLVDSPMQVHSYSQYQVPPPPPSKPPHLVNPLGVIDSSSGSIHRNHHYNYSL